MAWFIADLVVLITVEGAEASVVHVNTVLVEAVDADDAWEQARALGAENDGSHCNASGQRVDVRFQGIAELSEVWDDPLEHGSELYFKEHVGLTPAQIGTLVRPREHMTVFRREPEPVDPRRPDYADAEVVAEAVEVLRAWGVPHLRLVTDDEEE
jgi:hypothetical protein